MNLVSLFGGISGIEEAFRQLGLRPRTNMYEINPKALAISRRNFPETIQRGSVVGEDWRRLGREIGPVDMLCGGFPCQDLSNANPKGLGLEGDRSGLFYNLMDAMETLQPKNFLIENVVPKDAKRLADLDKVSSYLGVPYQILQNAESGPVMRKRAIWTNLPISPPPASSPTALEFLAGRSLGPDVPAEALQKYYSSKNPNTFKKHKIPTLGVTHDKFKTLLSTANLKDVYNNAYQLGEGGPIQYVHPDTWYELFGFPKDYWKGEKVTLSQALSRLGNSFTIPMINRVLENYMYHGVPLKDWQRSESGLLLPPVMEMPPSESLRNSELVQQGAYFMPTEENRGFPMDFEELYRRYVTDAKNAGIKKLSSLGKVLVKEAQKRGRMDERQSSILEKQGLAPDERHSLFGGQSTENKNYYPETQYVGFTEAGDLKPHTSGAQLAGIPGLYMDLYLAAKKQADKKSAGKTEKVKGPTYVDADIFGIGGPGEVVNSNPLHEIARQLFGFGRGVGRAAGESVGQSPVSNEIRGIRAGLAPFMMGMQNLGEEVEKQGFTGQALTDTVRRLLSKESLMSLGKSLIPYVAPAEMGGAYGEEYLPGFIPQEYRYLGGFLGGLGAEALAAPVVGTAMGVHGAAKTLEPWERMATRGRHPAIPAPGGLGGYGFHPKEYYDAAENYVNEAREAQNKPPANSFVI